MLFLCLVMLVSSSSMIAEDVRNIFTPEQKVIHISMPNINLNERSLFQDLVNSIKFRKAFVTNNRNQYTFSSNVRDNNDHTTKQEEFNDLNVASRTHDLADLTNPFSTSKLIRETKSLSEPIEVSIEKEELKSNDEVPISTDVNKAKQSVVAGKKGPPATKRPQQKNNNKESSKANPIKNKQEQEVEEQEVDDAEDLTNQDNLPNQPHKPQNNNMSGQSQIGNRESQMVIKPTVIINFRGTVTNRDSDIKMEGRQEDDNGTSPSIFNINQEINIEKTYAIIDENRDLSNVRGPTDKRVKESIKSSLKVPLHEDDADLKRVKDDVETLHDEQPTHTSRDSRGFGKHLEDFEEVRLFLKNGPLGRFMTFK